MDRAVDSSALVRGFRLALTIQGLRPHTVDCYVRDASRFVSWLDKDADLDSLTAERVRTYFRSFQEGRSKKTLHDAQLAVRRFFRFLTQEGEIRRDPTRELKLATFRTEPQPIYTEVEVKRLLMVCGASTPDAVRDRALILTLFDTGVRAGELVSMGLPDWERRAIRVTGKTGARQVPLGTAVLQALERYTRRWAITEPPLWRGKRGPLTTSGALQIVKKLCRKAGAPDKGCHAFRRAAAAQMKRAGMQDSDIMEVMGWRDVLMLRRYTAAVAEELAHQAHERYSPGDGLRLR